MPMPVSTSSSDLSFAALFKTAGLVSGASAAGPRRIFVGVSIAVLVLYSLGHISAALAPYKEGAALFNVVTVLATELMHVVSGLLVLATFPRVLDR